MPQNALLPTRLAEMRRENTFAQHWPYRMIEWLFAAVLFGVGIVYSFADALWTTPLYRAHSNILPSWAWAVGGLGIGGLRLTALYINGLWRRSPLLRSITAALSCLMWAELSIAVLQAPVAGATVVVWPLFLLFDGMVAFRAIREAARTDAEVENGRASGTDRAS